MDATMFAPQISDLSDEFRVVAYNSRVLIGSSGPHSLDDLVSDCLALLDELRIDRCVLAGMSVGGYMATLFALQHPERLAGLVLIGAPSGTFSESDRRSFEKKFAELDIDGPVPAEFAEWVAPFCFGKTTRLRNPQLVRQWVYKWTTTLPARSVYHQALSWIAKADITAELSRVSTPTLLVHGEEDDQNPIEMLEPMLAQLSDVELARIPKAGHSSNLENPQLANAALRRFLRRASQTSSVGT